MINNEYDKIPIPYDIDKKIEKGVEMAVKEKLINRKKHNKKLVGCLAASIALVITCGISNPALAAKIPVVGSVFEAIEQNIYFPGNYSEYATSVNETVTSNGVSMTLSDILCDGQSLYVTYIIENDEPFKYTSWDDDGSLDMNQLIPQESYSKVDFTNKELDNTGISGLEGKFIDENTFVGVEKYKLSSLNEDIPDEFTFQVKYNSIRNNALNDTDKDYIKKGTWAFKVPVKVNKDLKNIITPSNAENDIVKVNSISITPFDTLIDIYYKSGDSGNYSLSFFDENNNELMLSESQTSEDRLTEKFLMKTPQENFTSIRVLVEKVVTEEINRITHEDGSYESESKEISRETVFDQTISVK